MSRTKSKPPFLIHRQFLSPLLCEDIVYSLGCTVPDVTVDKVPLMSVRHHERSEEIVFERIEPLFELFEKHYNVQYRGTEKMLFEWVPQGAQGKLACDGSEYIKNKWVRTRDRDLTAIIFLSDYNENASFDTGYEVYGGKLEFPNHGFGFNPERGTMVVFPSTPHFLNTTAPVLVADLYQIRIHMATKTPFLYQPSDFPGNYLTWFPQFLS